MKFLLGCFLFIFVLGTAWAQERVVAGIVTATEDGSTLPGVNVVLKGTTNGTVTNAEGSYKLNIPASGGVLVFSFIGLQTQEVAVGERSVVDIGLGLDVKQLSEIVVTGTGVPTEKRKLAIAVESVSADKLPAAPTASIDQALIGKIAGAQISSTDGTPGANINILLRGVNSINRGTSPMIMLDGVQMGATTMNSIDLNTIDRVEVIQGAAAGTIYGAQGANGVIQLFTKKGKGGKLNVDFSTSVSQNTLLNSGNLRQSQFHNFATNPSTGSLVDGNGADLVIAPNTQQYTGNVVYNALDPVGKANKPFAGNQHFIDYFALYIKPSSTINNSLVLSGGKEKSDFSISISNNHQDSNFKGEGYNDRTNVTTNLGFEIAKGLELRSITQLVYTKNTISFFNQPGYGGGSTLYRLLNTRPFADYEAKDPDGNYAYNLGGAVGANATNPNYRLANASRTDNKIDIVQSFALNYKLPRFVELSAKYGLNYQTDDEKDAVANQSQIRNFTGAGSFMSIYGNSAGEIDKFSSKNIFHNFLAQATAVFDFEKDFKMSIPLKSSTTVAYDFRQSDRYLTISYGLNLPTFLPTNTTQANTWKTLTDTKTPFVTYGYLINQRFDFADFAGVSVGVRSDYSSAFGAGSKPFTFPRADGYFRFSGLKFWDNTGLSRTILDFKVRAAWGKAGIQPLPFDRYQTLSTRVYGAGTSLYYPATQSNPNLDVEVSEELELGADMSLDLLSGDWLKTLNLSVTVWDRKTDNAIYDVDTAPSRGVGTVKTNAFGLASNGLQFSLNMPILTRNKFNWNLTTNFSQQISKVSSVVGGAEVVVLSNAGSSNYILRAGETVGQLYGYRVLRDIGMLNQQGQPVIPVANQGNYEVASNGYVINKTTKQPVGTSQLYSLGNSFPKFNMSFINEFTFKNFLSFGFQIDWVYKSHLYNQTKSWMYRDGVHSDYETPITVNGETGAWTAFYRGVYQAGSNNGTKDYFYEDATFARLRNVSIGADFAKLFKIGAFRKLQLVLSGRNLATITNYTGMDPEVSSGASNTSPSATAIGSSLTNSAFDRGVDHNTMPNYKSYQFTLNIGF